MSSVSSAAASASAATTLPSFQWSLYYHATQDSEWHAGSFAYLGSFTSFPELWGSLKRIETHFPHGMYFLMKGVPQAGTHGRDTKWERGHHPPLWEHRYNNLGGAYCVKVEKEALNVFQHYAAAAILGEVTRDPTNPIIGVTISPKKGFSILKLWNLSADTFNDPKDVKLLPVAVKTPDILYRRHGDARM
jgi:hypothetical protein